MRSSLVQTIYLTCIVATIVGCNSAANSANYTVCDESAVAAAAKLVGYSDTQIAEMGQRRSVFVPKFRALADELPLDRAIQTYYLRNQPRSAVLVYAADAEHICAFIFKADAHQAEYYRRKYKAGKLTVLMKELALKMNLNSLWEARSGKKTSKPVTLSKTDRSEQDILKDVSLELFWPSMRSALSGVKHLSVVPIKEISSIPIAALEPFGDGRKTIDIFSVNILAFLADLKMGPMPWPRKIEQTLIVGNPRPSLDGEYLWSPLPGAEKEAMRVKEVLGGTLLLRENATKKSVLRSIAKADLIYFASHGLSDESKPLDGSYIVLANSRLTAREVQHLKLPKRPIVVLSACHTGEGQVMEAGIVGIARAFQLAKAWNTVMSLWAVEDEATAKLMAVFSERLREVPPAEAMRIAMLRLRKTHPHPRYWAAFNVFGNSGQLRGP